MIELLCMLLPFLLGALLSWLLAGWLARRLKNAATVEKIVEKSVDRIVDNPEHLALISRLEGENKEIAGLKTKIAGFQSSSSKTKAVDNPAHLARIKELEGQVNRLQSSSSNTKAQSAMSATTKTVDNPAHISRIKELEAQVSKLQSAKPDTAQAAISAKTKTVDNPVHLKRISALEAEVSSLRQGPTIDLAAAKAAGFTLKGVDDFTAVEGIGPKINDLIHADGVKTFSELADTPVSSIQTVLDKAGPSYKIANPGTWPDQANLAANNRWPALRALQDVLIGGVYPDPSKKSSSDDSAKSVKSASDSTSKVSSSAQAAVSTVDKSSAKAAGFRVKAKAGEDDFTVVEGIGPKINGLIHDAGIHTYAVLGKTSADTIQKILTDAGPRYSLAKPGTWPKQAEMAAENKWEALKAWQDELDGGK